ncbi:MAG: asparagine synthase (glutamine-hydrolyzing) [Deltaproteobacteria bacterium]|nr:asparagine synthase (glutamine-hydrolyzing) [Deltaproteobacteria bacterium]
MCGIAGAIRLDGGPIPDLEKRLEVMSALIAHRGPDGEGTWRGPRDLVGLAHRRLSIIDIDQGAQPMRDRAGNVISYNGEVYNFIELRQELGLAEFETKSDTEAILVGYQRWGERCVSKLRGMFAFALWDPAKGTLLCARDRFGIKPFYYTVQDGILYFASEAKALLPFVPQIETDLEGLKDYLAFQLCLAGKTLFKGIKELLPGHLLRVKNGQVVVERYWNVYYALDWDHTQKYFEERIRELFHDSVKLHLRSDVPVGGYISGGFDSSMVGALAARLQTQGDFVGFTGKFAIGPEFDESPYARMVAQENGFHLYERDIGVDDFIENIRRVVYHLDYPVAGPGSFPQFMVSELAAQHRKVVLGGQGGDEVFGGYVRYLIAYFEQCIKAAIDGTMTAGNFVVTYESIIPNLTALRQYKPLLKEFWKDGLFDDLDQRYFRLISRTPRESSEIRWPLLGDYSPYETFREIFRASNVAKESYFDSMTHFDFKTLLPALLQVEDRVSMAHGLEARVPILDHPLVELAATIPSNIKFESGTMKHVLKQAMGGFLPAPVRDRKDKMGFPVPLLDWLKGPANGFLRDVFGSAKASSRDLVDNRWVVNHLAEEPRFGRKIWGLLCLELWQQEFHDREAELKARLRS